MSSAAVSEVLAPVLLSSLRQSQNADIINMVSISGLTNAPMQGGSAAYLASKQGQDGLTEALLQEPGSKPSGSLPSIRNAFSMCYHWIDWRRTKIEAWLPPLLVEGAVLAMLTSLTRARRVTYQSIALESNNSHFHTYLIFKDETS